MILIRSKQAALIEFETLNFATQAKDYLNNSFYMKIQLKVNYYLINIKGKLNRFSTPTTPR